jgi:hypothetical protein
MMMRMPLLIPELFFGFAAVGGIVEGTDEAEDISDGTYRKNKDQTEDMSSQLDAKFFRKAKKVNRAVEITETQAYIPAVKDSPEIRVPLPNRRLKTMEEREAELTARYENIATLEEDIERERKSLNALISSYRELGSGAADVVVQNQKVRDLMERRKSMAYPQIWIESLSGVTRTEVFESKRDTRKLPGGGTVYQVKRRVEPISSLYVDNANTDTDADRSAADAESEQAVVAPSVGVPSTAKTAQEVAAETKRGAIVQQVKKKSFKVANP